MKARLLIALAACACPAAAIAQSASAGVMTCDEAGVGLWSVWVGADLSGVRSYYEGSVTLLAIDTIEPACCSAGVAIVMPGAPQENEPLGPACWAIKGFADVDLRATRSSYDPRQGLTLAIPTRNYDPETGGTIPGEPIRLRIDAGRGTIIDLSRR